MKLTTHRWVVPGGALASAASCATPKAAQSPAARPPSAAPGLRSVKGQGTADGFSITRFERLDDKGLDGTFNVDPAVVSRPAVPRPGKP